MMKIVKGFAGKQAAESYQAEHGGVILWAEWSRKYATFTMRGKLYNKAIADNDLFGRESENKYIIVEKEQSA